MHAWDPPDCGTYYRLENRWRARLNWPHRKQRIGGSTHPLFALRSSRVPRYNLTLPADLLRVKYGSGNRHPWNLPLRAAPLHTHPASRQSSLHHLPVRRAACQLGCLDMRQKHHEPPPTFHWMSEGACPDEAVFLPKALLGAAAQVASQVVLTTFLPGRSRARAA